MKLLILSENYPHAENLMGDVFVHVRAKEYAKRHSVQAFAFFYKKGETEYERIPVRFFSDEKEILRAAEAYKPDRILIHFYKAWMLEGIIKKIKVPVIIWVHGYEALGWYRRLFNFSWYSPVLFNYIMKNTVQQYQFHNLIRLANRCEKIQFVFVSDWMRKITEKDCFARIRRKHIIPNPIDTDLFRYHEKEEKLRSRILLLRSFVSRKYANDVAVDAILRLSSRPCFHELKFTLIGQGPLFERLTAPLKRFSNVDLESRVVEQGGIPALHATHGIFLCPTRQDSQGVSMCEAMSSGLVPITTRNSAIPEFVADQRTGFLARSSEDIAEAIERLYLEPKVFLRMSAAAAAAIRKKCSLREIVPSELALIEQAQL